jgi:peptide-methionine (S)-S-oxide reductase
MPLCQILAAQGLTPWGHMRGAALCVTVIHGKHLAGGVNDEPTAEVAILGGGCFWCLEAVYLEDARRHQSRIRLHGRARARPELRAGVRRRHRPRRSGAHRIRSAQLSYRDILEVFFTIHDPTTPNRQGNDVGTQYRSVIFYQSPEQEATARQVIAEMANVWDAPIVTETAPPQPGTRPRITTRITSASIRCKAIAPSWWRPRWPSSGRRFPAG